MAERKIEQKSLVKGRRRRSHNAKNLAQANCNRNRNWHQDELQKLAAFIHHHKHKLTICAFRKQSKIFKMMSLYLSTRNSNQCRAYTHKLLKKFKTIDAVDEFFKACLRNYETVIDKEEGRLKKMIFPLPVIAMQRKEHSVLTQEKVQKQQEKDMKPTDTDYYENGQIKKDCDESKLILKKTANQQLQTDSIKQTANSMQFYRNCLNSPILCQSSVLTTPKIAPAVTNLPVNSQQLLQCYNLFLQWTMKLSKLIQRHSF